MSFKGGSKYYAVAIGRKTGIFTMWNEVKTLVDGYQGARHKSFKTYDEANNYLLNFYNKSIISNEVKSFKVEPNKIISNDFDMINKTVYYTDGSHNDGYGGYGIVVVENNIVKNRYSGPVPEYPTTNNRSELFAILTVLSNFKEDLLIRTDSKYCIDSLTTYISSWIKNNWIKSDGEPVKNTDLIINIVHLSQNRKITFEHVKAHSGHNFNEMADSLANNGRQNYNK